MPRKRFTEEQIAFALRQGESGTPVKEVVRKLGITEQTHYRWKECRNKHWFLSLDDARQKMEDWRRDYNEVRPHSAIGNKAPITLLNGSSAPLPT